MQCSRPGGWYTTLVHVKAFTDAEVAEAEGIVRETAVWKKLVQHGSAVNGDPSALDALKFAQAPFDLTEKLFNYDHKCASEFMHCGCNCPGDPAAWCKHVAALCYALLDEVQTKPMVFLEGLGVDLHAMLENDRAEYKAKKKRACTVSLISPSTSSRAKRTSTSSCTDEEKGSAANPIELE